MRTIVHLSDLHFGRVDYSLIQPLVEAVKKARPDIVAVSGDLTQRARREEFKEARRFLDQLPSPQIIVPGNHDVPLYNALARFMGPLDKYRRYITDDLQPFYSDDEIAILGINTARSLTFKNGRVSREQIAAMRERLCGFSSTLTKIVVTHHPFDLPEGHGEGGLVGRARLAMEALAGCGADVLLAGHLHLGHTGHTAKRYRIEGHSALVVSAGTATSTRGRGEPNSFNVIRINRPQAGVERYTWRPEVALFALASIENFKYTAEGWVRIDDEATGPDDLDHSRAQD
jgi:3',5'-cyclic AMP phosphodiesterase CpdA